jgi:TPR repeat protein
VSKPQPGFICFYRPGISHSLRFEADQGDAEAQFELGRLYLEGRDEQSHTSKNGSDVVSSFTPAFARNQAEAALWLQKAADQGHGEAHRLLEAVRAEPRGVH